MQFPSSKEQKDVGMDESVLLYYFTRRTKRITTNWNAFFVIVKSKSPVDYLGTNVTLNDSPRYPVNTNESGLAEMPPPTW